MIGIRRSERGIITTLTEIVSKDRRPDRGISFEIPVSWGGLSKACQEENWGLWDSRLGMKIERSRLVCGAYI